MSWLLVAVLAACVVELRRRLELVARAEHELRSPTSVLSLAVERMSREPAGGRYARPLDAELERLRAGLADLAAARGGRRGAGGARRTRLEPLVRSGLDAWRPVLRRAGRPLRLDWRAGPVEIRADRGRMAQALGNLVANAAEHGDGPVELRASRSGRAVRLEVSNRPRPGEPGPAPGRGRGLQIAADAARDAGGSLRLAARDGRVVAALELPEDRDEPPCAA